MFYEWHIGYLKLYLEKALVCSSPSNVTCLNFCCLLDKLVVAVPFLQKVIKYIFWCFQYSDNSMKFSLALSTYQTPRLKFGSAHFSYTSLPSLFFILFSQLDIRFSGSSPPLPDRLCLFYFICLFQFFKPCITIIFWENEFNFQLLYPSPLFLVV